jgi:hypothetical protein
MALASAILLGASTPFSKLLLGEVDPQLLAGLLYLGAGVGLAFVERPASIFSQKKGRPTACRRRV